MASTKAEEDTDLAEGVFYRCWELPLSGTTLETSGPDLSASATDEDEDEDEDEDGLSCSASLESLQGENVSVDLQEKLEAAHKDQESMYTSYKEVDDKFNDLNGKNELSTGILHKIYDSLWKLVNEEENETDIQTQKLLDPLHFSNYDTLVEQLKKLLGERLHLQSVNNKLKSELMDKTKDIEELSKRCLGSDVIMKLVEGVKGADFDTDEPSSFLESSIYFLIEKYKEADERINLSSEDLGSKEMKMNELQGQKDQLSFSVVQRENEIIIFNENLRRAMEDLAAVRFEVQEKVTELEQSEQRVSSLGEKLGIGVTKGKALLAQRGSLKQSLAEKSSELESCLQELQLKDSTIHEVETELKTYSEAGEHVEALETELSYIRNSATALRESFLLKDSVIQRIEEILEDLELPERFHARDIIEKVDWLARSVTGNSLPPTHWDQRSSSDAGFVVMEGWKGDLQPNSNLGDDFRRKYEELQSRLYGLAEQNEMLEQSIMERNNLVQRWEEILEKINTPFNLRSMEPEDRIEWLGGALTESVNHCDSLQEKLDNMESYCGSLTADIEESQKRISDLEAALQSVTSEKEHLSGSFDTLVLDFDKVSEKAALFEVRNDELQNEVTALKESLGEKLGVEEHIHQVEGEIRRLEGIVNDVLQESTEDLVLSTSSTECLELSLRKLIEKYRNLSLGKLHIQDADVEPTTEILNATRVEKRMRDSGDVEELEQRVTELQDREADSIELQARVRSLTYVLLAKEQEIEALMQALDEEEAQMEDLRNKIEELEKVVQQKNLDLDNTEASRGKAMKNLSITVSKFDELHNISENLLFEVEKLQSQLQDRDSEIPRSL